MIYINADLDQCDVDDPCLTCPKASSFKTSGSCGWLSVGCKRGSFKEELSPLYLCPDSDLEVLNVLDAPTDEELPASVNERSRREIDKRDEAIKGAVDTMPPDQDFLDVFLQSLNIGPRPLERTYKSSIPTRNSLQTATLAPLEECIAAIIYEATTCSRSISIITNRYSGRPWDVVALLRAAA
jgi:hypothetical protein